MATAATQDEKKPARTKNPSYDVFRADESGYWTKLNDSPVAAGNRREAISKATAKMSEESRYGQFAVVRSGEFKVLTRTQKVEPQDVWS